MVICVIVGDAVAPVPATEGAFRHLRALQDIASMSGGRAAGTPGYDRFAEYVADGDPTVVL